MGYIEPPPTRPTIYSSTHETASEMDSPSAKVVNVTDSQKS